MSGICRGRVVRITRADRSPGHEHALALAAEGDQYALPDPGETAKAVTDEGRAHCGTAIAGPGIDSRGATA